MVQVDVFTDRALTGNALAVFPDGRGLSTEQMQALARETNLSETTFILPGDAAAEKTRGVRVRIFTVQEELPFAGHPTLGTAFVLRGQAGAAEVRLDLNVGTVPVRFTEEPPQPAFGEMTQKDPEFGAIHNVDDVARLTGLTAADFDDSAPIQTVSTGFPFTIAALRSLQTLCAHPNCLDWVSFHHRGAAFAEDAAEASPRSRPFRRISSPQRRKVLLLCLPRDGQSESPSPRPHDFL